MNEYRTTVVYRSVNEYDDNTERKKKKKENYEIDSISGELKWKTGIE